MTLKKTSEIPEIDFTNWHKKKSDFQILTNKEVFVEKPLPGHSRFKPHRIQFYSIIFIRSGKGNHFIDFKTYDYQKGTIFFIAREQVHAFEWNDQREAQFLTFTEDFFQKSRLGSTLIHSTGLFNYQMNEPKLQLNDEQFERFDRLVTLIEKEYGQMDEFVSEEIILSSLRIFLCFAERIRMEHQKELPISKYKEEFIYFQRLLKQHLFESRMVQFYAEKLNYSTKKLNRMSKDVVQRTAKDYINDLLIMEIKRFLMNTNLSIKEISFKVGFEEPTNFIKYFKKYTNKTPSQFRKDFLV